MGKFGNLNFLCTGMRMYLSIVPKDDSLEPGDALLAASVGAAVAKHREAEKLSMAELARKAGMSRAYLWRVEQGVALPGLRNLARIAIALGVPIARLLDGADMSGIRMSNRAYEASLPGSDPE